MYVRQDVEVSANQIFLGRTDAALVGLLRIARSGAAPVALQINVPTAQLNSIYPTVLSMRRRHR